MRAWEHLAACKGMSPEVFASDTAAGNQMLARQTCWSRCDVRVQCLEWQMAQEWGRGLSSRDTMVYGGMGPRERYRLQQQRNASVASTG